MPFARLGLKALTCPHIPLNAHLIVGQLHHLHVDTRLLGLEIGRGAEMGHTVLALHRVVGLATVHPVAIDADAHAAAATPASHSGGWPPR